MQDQNAAPQFYASVFAFAFVSATCAQWTPPRPTAAPSQRCQMPAAAATGAALLVQEGDQRLVPVECGAAEPLDHLQDVSLPAAQLGGRKAV